MSERQRVHPSDMDFSTPGRRDYAIVVEHPTLWGAFFIPLTVFVGRQAVDGQGVLAIGGTHGDEYEGPIAIKNVLREIKIGDVCGRIILIPVLNVMAFRTGTRDTCEDGINLNRAFPGDAGSSISYQVADVLNRVVFPHVHVVLDIHSGGKVARFPYLTEFHRVDDPQRAALFEMTARVFGAPFTQLYQKNTPGVLITQAHDLGKITIGTELGWGQSSFAGGVACARRGVLANAIQHGQLTGDMPEATIAPDNQILVDTTDFSCNLFAEFDGHFEPLVECGCRVEVGRVIGHLHDFDRIDDIPAPIVAPHDGYVISQAMSAVVFRGQLVSQVAKPARWTE